MWTDSWKPDHHNNFSCLPFYDPVVGMGSVGSHSHNIYDKRHIQGSEGMA